MEKEENKHNLKIVPKPDSHGRFIIINGETGEVLDDAQGYGYKTTEGARKALWYKFKNGKEKLNKEKHEALDFFKKNIELKKRLNELFEMNYKELALGETTEEEILNQIKEEFKTTIPKKYLKYF
jgi:hypothetical protein